ncbi:alpha/beta hydrolase [Methylobacterium sp. Leaf100]|uniref:alpha/beta hydrolase n=1 Tax=Methylobacterium sp. Leaf100 TaxID=1736252 RepID=UPI0006F327B3|nr:alpha/beta hydrolase [Methylobacterium sp. Leaf100]KQP18906.1 alpha/beta hydrolase [Methylobacterium sp. Leaf100]
MGLDPAVRRFLDMMALGGTGARGVAERRKGQQVLAQLAGAAPVAVAARDLVLDLPSGPCAARAYAPRDAGETGPGLVFFHGGGLVSGDLDTHDAICRILADSADCRVVAVAYRLAPEHPYPAAIEDAVAAFAHVAQAAEAFGLDASRLGIGGDSAGAGLAARTTQMLRGRAAIAGQLLICPVLDLTCATESHRAFATGHFLDAETVRHDIAACGVADVVADPRVSPGREPDLTGLPPAHIHTASHDIMRDDGAAYAARLAEARIPVVHTCHAGMIHYFYGLGRLIPTARPILAEIGAAFGAHLRGDPARTIPQSPHRRAS